MVFTAEPGKHRSGLVRQQIKLTNVEDRLPMFPRR